MSVLDDKKQNNTEAPVEDTLELEDLIGADDFDEFDKLTATLHFEFNDILNAIEHIEQQSEEEPEPEVSAELEEEEMPVESIEGVSVNHDITSEFETESAPVESVNPDVTSELETPEPEEPDEFVETEPEEEPGLPEIPVESEEPELVDESPEESDVAETEDAEPDESAESAEPDESAESAEPDESAESESAPSGKTHEGLITKYKHQDQKTKKLVLTDIILFAVIAASIIAGLLVAHSLVNKANAANEAKIAEMQTNIKEIDLAESLYDYAADEVIEDIAVPTYTLDQLYALDLRKKTGFTVEDLKMITRKGLVGCEEAFVKAEETYGVNSIFLMSIASLESAYGTQMFRPNNMFGYGRTGFSSKEECIMTVAKGLGTRYLNPGGGLYGGSPTLKGVNKRYAANPQWYYKVGKYMQGYYNQLAAEKNGTLDKFE